MKPNLFFALGGISLLLAGCAAPNNNLVLQGVGPGPVTPDARAATGTLTVFSAYQVNADFNSRDTHRPEYTDYRILTADGTPQQAVRNNSGTLLQRPRQVDLPAGKYRVVAQANGYGLVTVPVTIEPGLDTVLHLEGGYRWPNPRASESNTVRLPDGEIVGWRDTMAAK